MKPITKPTIFLVRHGEINDNVKDRLPGWRDEAMNEKGLGEAQDVAAQLKNYPLAHMYVGPLKRTRQVAAAIQGATGVPASITYSMSPWNYGDIAGMKNDKRAQTWLQHFQSHPDVKTPNGESYNEFLNRFTEGLHQMREHVKQHPEKALVGVTHSRNLLALKHALGDRSAMIPTDKSQVGEAAIKRIEFEPDNKFSISEEKK